MILPKAIIFDLDDTLVSLKATADSAWKLISQEYSSRNKNVEYEALYDKITKVRLAYWADKNSNDRGRKDQKEARREILRKAFEELCLPEDDAVDMADIFTEKRLETLRLFPGAEKTLQFLKQNQLKLALITNGEAKMQRLKIELFQLEKYFDCILIETELGFGKPDPRIYTLAMETMKVVHSEAWSIGDHLIWDVEAPQKLGIYSIWNDFENIGLPLDSRVIPDRIIHTVNDIMN